MFCNIIVFPAFGGDITRPLCPLPIGEAMSISLADMSSELPFPCSSLNLLFAWSGVKFSNNILFFVLDDVSELILSILRRAKYLSLSFGGLIFPCIVSPVRSENFLI